MNGAMNLPMWIRLDVKRDDGPRVRCWSRYEILQQTSPGASEYRAETPQRLLRVAYDEDSRKWEASITCKKCGGVFAQGTLEIDGPGDVCGIYCDAENFPGQFIEVTTGRGSEPAKVLSIKQK